MAVSRLITLRAQLSVCLGPPTQTLNNITYVSTSPPLVSTSPTLGSCDAHTTLQRLR